VIDVRGLDPDAARATEVVGDEGRCVADGVVIFVCENGEAEVVVDDAMFNEGSWKS